MGRVCFFFILLFLSYHHTQSYFAHYEGNCTTAIPAESFKIQLHFLAPASRDGSLLGNFKIEKNSQVEEGKIEGNDFGGYAFQFTLLGEKYNYHCWGEIKSDQLVGEYIQLSNKIDFSAENQTQQGSFEALLINASTPTTKPAPPEGHTRSITSVCFSPEGNILASASHDKTIKIWSVSSGKVLQTLSGHSDIVWSVHFHPEGNILASGSHDHTIKLWDISTGKIIRTFTGHTSFVSSVRFHPNGKWLASASTDKTVSLWDLNTGERLFSLLGHTQPINSIDFSPDGKHIASASTDKTVRVWSVETQTCLNIFGRHSSPVTTVCFSPDGKTIYSGCSGGILYEWAPFAENNFKIFAKHNAGIESLTLSSNGENIFIGTLRRELIWYLKTGEQKRIFSDYEIGRENVAFHPKNNQFVSACWYVEHPFIHTVRFDTLSE